MIEIKNHKKEYLEILEKGSQVCTVCNTEKPLGEFYLDKRLDKHTRRCKECRREYNKINAERIKELRRIRVVRPEIQARIKASRKRKYWEDKQGSLFTQARRNHRNIECTLVKEDIVIPTNCPIFDVPFDRGRFAPSLDRFDNTRGYHKDNIWVISKLANTMKNSATIPELKKFCESFTRILQEDIVQTT